MTTDTKSLVFLVIPAPDSEAVETDKETHSRVGGAKPNLAPVTFKPAEQTAVSTSSTPEQSNAVLSSTPVKPHDAAKSLQVYLTLRSSHHKRLVSC